MRHPSLVWCTGEAALAYESMGDLPRAASILLFGCAGVQVIAFLFGVCGIRNLNRECICTALCILLLAAAALGWVGIATYLWLRDTTPVHPLNLLLVFGVAMVAEFFILVTLTFVACAYRALRGAIREEESSAEMREDYSDYTARDHSYGRNGKNKKPKVRASMREYLPNDQL